MTGKRVRLREFAPGDRDAVHGIIGDDRVTWYLSFDSRSREQAEAILTDTLERARQVPRTEYYLAITPADTDELVGFARLVLAEYRPPNSATPSPTDAVHTMLDFAFGPLGLHRVTAAIGPENAASMKVAERAGFRREGVLRDHVHTNGAWRDSILVSVLADDVRHLGGE